MNLVFNSSAPACSSASPKALRFVLLSALPMLVANPFLGAACPVPSFVPNPRGKRPGDVQIGVLFGKCQMFVLELSFEHDFVEHSSSWLQNFGFQAASVLSCLCSWSPVLELFGSRVRHCSLCASTLLLDETSP
jgi:hypothetical protein